ncbi:MAG: hypothetical protein V4819_24120 [Verrucomicrobiota bacterium]
MTKINHIARLAPYFLSPLLIVSGISMDVYYSDLIYIFFALLIVSILMALFGFKHAYSALRVSLVFGAGFLGISLVSKTVFNTLMANAFSQLSRNEFVFFATAIAIFSIPVIVGILAAIGPKYSYVRMMGRIVLYGISPALVIWAAITQQIRWESPKTFWILSYVVSSAICWEILTRARSQRPNTSWVATGDNVSI